MDGRTMMVEIHRGRMSVRVMHAAFVVAVGARRRATVIVVIVLSVWRSMVVRRVVRTARARVVWIVSRRASIVAWSMGGHAVKAEHVRVVVVVAAV